MLQTFLLASAASRATSGRSRNSSGSRSSRVATAMRRFCGYLYRSIPAPVRLENRDSFPPPRVPGGNVERERVSPRPAVEHPLQGRVGNEATIPIILAIDLGGRKAGWKRAAGDDLARGV